MKTVNFKEGQLTIVKIWCSVKNRVPYYIISKFFEFTGTFVSDDLIETKTSSIRNSDNVPTFYISNDIPISRDSKICYIDTSVEPWNNLTLENCSMKTLGGKTKEGKSIAFLPIIEYMKQVTEEFPEEIYSKLWNIFIENNLIKPFQNFAFFGVKVVLYEYINANSEQMMIKAMDYIDSINDNLLKDTFQYKYAEMYLKMLIFKTELYQFDVDWQRKRYDNVRYRGISGKYLYTKEGKKYPLYELCKACEELCNEYEWNTNLVYLMTKVLYTAYDHDGVIMCDESYNILIPKLEDYTSKSECFKRVLSDAYLSRGRYEEEHTFNAWEGCFDYTKAYKEYYAKSFQCGENYRNAYRVGCMFDLEAKQKRNKKIRGNYVGSYECAIKYFLKSRELLEVYSKGDMNVTEIKYYLSINAILCKLYNELEKYEKVIEYGLEAHQFYENVTKNESSYEKLYGNNVKFYWKACTSYEMGRIYEYLTIAYRKAGNMKESEFFRRLY